MVWKFKYPDVLLSDREIQWKDKRKGERWIKGGGSKRGMEERDSSKEGPSGREQKLQLAKKRFESRVRARFGSETCTLRRFISL